MHDYGNIYACKEFVDITVVNFFECYQSLKQNYVNKNLSLCSHVFRVREEKL